MDSHESFTFFKTQLARSIKGLEAARASRNLQLAALNTRQMFKANLMCGLIRWRQGESPVPHFKDAVALILRSSDLIHGWDASFVPAENLPVARGALLAALLDLPFGIPVSEQADLTADARLDWLLAQANSVAGAEAACTSATILLGGRDRVLALESYQTYFAILAARPNSDVLSSLVSRSEALFAQRENDAFFSGGEQTEGGGPDNALVVDYRLGVALKKVGYAGQSIHSWRW